MKITGTLAEKGLHIFDNEPHFHGGHKIPRIWVVVADREKAHIYRKLSAGLEPIADLKAVQGKTKNINGHVMKTQGPALKKDHDPRTRETHHGDVAFIHSLVQWLDFAEKEHVFDRLVFVAGPHTLGEIRTSLPHNVHDRVLAEIHKDLTGVAAKKIYDHIWP